MDIQIVPAAADAIAIPCVDARTPEEQAHAYVRHVIALTIKTFKGRRQVELLLFKANPVARFIMGSDEAILAKLRALPLVAAAPQAGDAIFDEVEPEVIKNANPDDALRSILESFTEAERDMVIDYVSKRYAASIEAIDACPLELPVPLGVRPLASLPEGKAMGFVHFERAQNYKLPFVLKGLYNLDQHEPMMPEHK
ncbi:MAG: hypothetical protein R3Y11_09940 [Pseudomonadota bacterium]